MQSQLVRTLRYLAADLNQRRVLQIDAHAGDLCDPRPQILNDGFDIFAAIVNGLEQNQNVAGVAGGADIALTNRR